MASINFRAPAEQSIENFAPIAVSAVGLTAGPVPDAVGRPLTGCVSSLSVCAPVEHAYTAALKSYAEVYTAAQDYLTPPDILSVHDYDRAIAMSMPELNRPEADHEMHGFVAPSEIPVSEEEIECCGYMAWLCH
jgi:hypothetical protein